MSNVEKRVIIEIDKANNRVVYVPCKYNCDILGQEHITITYQELVHQLKEQKNIYYITYKSYDPMINKFTGEQISGHLEKEQMTTGDLIYYLDKKFVFIE